MGADSKQMAGRMVGDVEARMSIVNGKLNQLMTTVHSSDAEVITHDICMTMYVYMSLSDLCINLFLFKIMFVILWLALIANTNIHNHVHTHANTRVHTETHTHHKHTWVHTRHKHNTEVCRDGGVEREAGGRDEGGAGRHEGEPAGAEEEGEATPVAAGPEAGVRPPRATATLTARDQSCTCVCVCVCV